MKKKTVFDILERGKFYFYKGSDNLVFKKGKVYKCWVKLPYMIIMSSRGRSIKQALGDFGLFNYPFNNPANWQLLKTIKKWKDVDLIKKLEEK